ncbi:MAG: NAD(P)H-dependent glycerol-3-phosphate dehydrogenase [Chitinophagaceae bacterium]|nr:NAD(P)H-dependent glycerol-3-phosphate dehydrogenase [Chitinophagaceae bacterium]
MNKITILGNGSWSSALAKMLTDNGHEISWWMRSKQALETLERTGHNPHYLSSVKYPMHRILLQHDLESAIREADIVLIGTPSAFIEEVLKELPLTIFQNKIILSAIKGILPVRSVLLNEYLAKVFQVNLNQYACITGPCHAEEVAAEKLSYLTFASQDENLAASLAIRFNNHYMKTVVSNDVFGVQYAAVLKNIYALGAGIAHGLDYGDNFLSVYITNCFSELQQFMEVISTQTQHHYNTSAYLGDLLVTCYSMHSRNRTFGNFIGKGYSVNAAKLELNMVAEGYYAAMGISKIAEKLNYHLPIADAIYRILWKQENPKTTFKDIEQIFS